MSKWKPRVFWIEWDEECDPFVMNNQPLFPSSAEPFVEHCAYQKAIEALKKYAGVNQPDGHTARETLRELGELNE